MRRYRVPPGTATAGVPPILVVAGSPTIGLPAQGQPSGLLLLSETPYEREERE